MANLLVAGAVSGLGKGMVAKAEEDYKTQASEADRMHDMQLENMRQKNLRELQQQRIDADEKSDTRRREFEAMSQDVMTKFQGEQGEAERKAGRESDLLKAQTDIYTTALRQYFQRSSKGSVSGGGWNSKFIERDQVWDAETGTFREQPPIVHVEDESTGRNYYQVGDKLFDAGAEPTVKLEPVDEATRAELYADLESGEILPEDFKRKMGYIPAEYVFGKIAKGNKGFAGVWEQISRMPAFALGQTGGTGNASAGVGGGGKGSVNALSSAAEAAGEVPPTAPADIQPEDVSQGGNLVPPDPAAMAAQFQTPAATTPTPRPKGALQQMYSQSGVAKGVVGGVKRIGAMPPAQAPRHTRAGSQQ
jgi:hypothetical protein